MIEITYDNINVSKLLKEIDISYNVLYLITLYCATNNKIVIARCSNFNKVISIYLYLPIKAMIVCFWFD